jgi:hypothetical protein
MGALRDKSDPRADVDVAVADTAKAAAVEVEIPSVRFTLVCNRA